MPTPLHAAGGFPPALVERLLDAALEARGTGRPFALAGPQGSGKSTLASQLVDAAAARGLRALSMSLDDVYLDRPERHRLAREVHPLLITRGPPGTHDIALACDVLDRLLAGRPARLPRFDKLADARLPESAWPRADAGDLLVVEGWCLGVPP
jgi:D-glycerate 3-kinase